MNEHGCSMLHEVNANRRAMLAGSAALCLGMALGGCEARFSGLFTSSDTHPSDYPTVEAVRFMSDYLAERTGGRLGIKVYPGGQLGSEMDTLELAIFGGLDLNRVNLAPLNSIAPLTIPPSLPFIFKSVDHMRQTMDGEIGNEILASLEVKGLIGLCFYDSGARSFYNTRGPIRTPEDMRGLKLRVPGSDAYVAMVNALGGNAVPIPFGEVYQALAQGVIDGAENNWPSFQSAGHFEVARFFSLTEHLLTPEVLVMSKIKWDNLPQEEQTLLREAARASVPVMRELWDARVIAAREAIAASGVEVNAVDPAPFAALMHPVWDEFASSSEQKSMVDRIVAAGENGVG